MRRIRPLLPLVALIVFVLACGRVSAGQASQEDLAVSPKSIEAPLLKVCLRLEDDSPFGGIMHVRILPAEGDDISGVPTGSDGETIFRNLQPGTYFLEAIAPGFVTIRREVRIDVRSRPPNSIRDDEAHAAPGASFGSPCSIA